MSAGTESNRREGLSVSMHTNNLTKSLALIATRKPQSETACLIGQG